LILLYEGSPIIAARSCVSSYGKTPWYHTDNRTIGRANNLISVNNAASNAQHARCYLRARHHGVLSTLSRCVAGYPYGSVVPFVLDHEAQPIILVSRLAEHTRNLEADARTSLVVRDDGDEVQAGARLTLLGNAVRVDCDPALRARFLRYQPQAQQLLGLGDFSYWRITPLTLRFIAGFGAIRWLSGSEFAPPLQALAQVEADIVAHMNAGLADTLRACCRGVLGREVNDAVMLGVDCDGFDVRADGMRLRFDFPETAPDAESVQRAVVEMGRDARTP
jgi:putative heme iron utilization protein